VEEGKITEKGEREREREREKKATDLKLKMQKNEIEIFSPNLGRVLTRIKMKKELESLIKGKFCEI
jgi:hypothetical protein